MPKIRKVKKRKTFRTNVNRKRMRNKLQHKGNIECQPIKKAWDRRKSVRKNLDDMGIAYDPNKVLEIPNFKQDKIKDITAIVKGEPSIEEKVMDVDEPVKIRVLNELESDAKAPRERRLMLPKGQVEFITYLMDKYGSDYQAMAKDRKNHYQETWKQLRAKIKTFMGIPKQYAAYLESRGKLEEDVDDETLKKEASALVAN